MGKSFTLESWREEIDNKYAPVDIALPSGKVVTLPALLRMKGNQRAETQKLMSEMGEVQAAEDTTLDDVVEVGKRALACIAGKADGKALVDAIGDDPALVLRVLEAWMDTSQPGEA